MPGIHFILFYFIFILFYYFILFYFILCFRPRHMACGILVPRPGIKPVPPALGAWSHNHWTTRDVPWHPF